MPHPTRKASGGPKQVTPTRRESRLLTEPLPKFLFVGLVSTLALQAGAAIFPSNWVWGVDLLAYLPPLLALSMVGTALVAFLPQANRALGGILELFGDGLREARTAAGAVISLATGVLLFALQTPIRFIGDSDLRLGLLTSGLETDRLFPQAFPLDLLLNAYAPRFLMSLGMTPEAALALVSAVVGSALVWVGYQFLIASGARGAALPTLLLVLLGGGYLLIFPGYDKFGPLLLGIGVASLGAVQLSRFPRGVWLLAVGTALAILSHRTGYLLLPSAALLIYQAFRSASNSKQSRHVLAAGALAVGTAAILLPRSIRLFREFDLGVHEVSFVSASASGNLASGLGIHIVDKINVLLFLTPLFLVGVLAVVVVGRSVRTQPPEKSGVSLWPAAGLAVGLHLVLLIATRGQQGAARDWDIYSGAGAVFSFALVYALTQTARRFDARHLWPPLFLTALTITVATWTVTVSETTQLRRIQDLITHDPQWNSEQRARAHDFLGWRAFNLGRFELAGDLFLVAIDAAPNPRYFYQAGLARWRSRDLVEARELQIEATRRAPAIADPWWVLSMIAYVRGDSASAIAYADSARARGSTRPPAGL